MKKLLSLALFCFLFIIKAHAQYIDSIYISNSGNWNPNYSVASVTYSGGVIDVAFYINFTYNVNTFTGTGSDNNDIYYSIDQTPINGSTTYPVYSDTYYDNNSLGPVALGTYHIYYDVSSLSSITYMDFNWQTDFDINGSLFGNEGILSFTYHPY